MFSEVINKQLEIADELLEVFPHALLLGGAPSNWFFKKEANDLDFYIYDSRGIVLSCLLHNKFISDWDDVISLKQEDTHELEDYDGIDILADIFEFSYKGMRVQFMIMKEDAPPEYIFEYFTSTICEFQYKDQEVSCSDDAKETIEYKKILFKKPIESEKKHYDKMKSYFPDYEIVENWKPFKLEDYMIPC